MYFMVMVSCVGYEFYVFYVRVSFSDVSFMYFTLRVRVSCVGCEFYIFYG